MTRFIFDPDIEKTLQVLIEDQCASELPAFCPRCRTEDPEVYVAALENDEFDIKCYECGESFIHLAAD